jgi:7,8-dihydroneopterin aldolase/epimerase/oxygenase
VGVVFLRDLRVETVIGVEERERLGPQPLLVNLEMDADLDAAARTDDLAHAVDYARVAELVREHAAGARFRLLEALAGSVADLVLERFPLVREAVVRIEKPSAVAHARGAGVELRRARQT